MAIFSTETTISPFGGDVLSTPIVLAYDGDKIIANSLFPQTDPLKSYFSYDLGKNSKGKSLIGTAYVNASVADIVAAISPALGLTIDYVFPIDGVNVFPDGVSVGFELSTPDTGTQIWAVENIINPTGSGSITDAFDADSHYYFNWTKGSPTASGTVTFDARLSIDALTATKPCSVIFPPSITATPALPESSIVSKNTTFSWDLYSDLADADSSWAVTNIVLGGATGTSIYIDNSDLLNPKLKVVAGNVASITLTTFDIYITSISNHACNSHFSASVLIS